MEPNNSPTNRVYVVYVRANPRQSWMVLAKDKSEAMRVVLAQEERLQWKHLEARRA